VVNQFIIHYTIGGSQMNVFMPYFITCSVEAVEYRGYIFVNKPVNLSLCQNIEKISHRAYPDNIGIPAISFNGCNTKWVYEDDKSRHEDFLRIINTGKEQKGSLLLE
jgi:hypothetical protein